MMDDPALDKHLDREEQQPIVIWHGIPCEVLFTYSDSQGKVWAKIRTLDGSEPFHGYTHGGWCHYDTTSVSEKWVKENLR